MTDARTEESDDDLVAAAGRGEAAACAALADRYLGRVERLARRTLGDADEACDVAQETFLRVWEQASRWKPGAAKFSTWLYRVTYNRCIDRIRQRRPRIDDDDLESHLEPSPSAAAVAGRRETVTVVRAAVAALPERQRAALGLCHYEGLTNIEAAAVMGLSIEALESLLARARRTLRGTLSAAWGRGEDHE